MEEITLTLGEFLDHIRSKIVSAQQDIIEVSGEWETLHCESQDGEYITRTLRPYRDKLETIAVEFSELLTGLQEVVNCFTNQE